MEIREQWTRSMVELRAKHMNIAFPKKYFDDLKLASMLDMKTRFA